MPVQDRATLKSYFETGDIPTEAQFVDVFDSTVLQGDAKTVTIQVTNGATPLAAGDGQAFFRVPASLNGATLSAVAASTTVPSSSGTIDIQIARGRQAAPGTAHAYADMLSTVLTIDQNEYDSKDATTPPVINPANDDVAEGDLLRIDLDSAGSAPSAVLSVSLSF